MANRKYIEREMRKKGQKAPVPVPQDNKPGPEFTQSIPLSEDEKYYIEKGQGQPLNRYAMGDPNKMHGNMTAEQSQYYDQGKSGPRMGPDIPPSQRPGGQKAFDSDKKRLRDTREVSGESGLLRQLERGETPTSDKKKKEEDAAFFSKLEKGGMMYEEGGEVKSKVMSMLDGMEDMPAEAEVVKMIVDEHGVSEDEAKAMIAEYKQSKMGMGGKMEYEGGGAMKLMRDPKDMVGMTMAGGAKIVS
jgi:hypothetical protein